MSHVERYSKGQPSLRYVDHGGEGPVLLLLHGVSRCGEDWAAILPRLVSTHRVMALDHRGHGGSARSDRYLVTDYVSDAVRFVRDELSVPTILFGHSLGAMVAAAVAAELPQQVSAAILEDPPFHTMGNKIDRSAWQVQFIGMQRVARVRGSLEQIADGLAEIRIPIAGIGFKRLGELRDRASLVWSAECLSQLDPEVFTPVIAGRWLDGYDFASVLGGIRCPVLLLQGDPSAGGVLTDSDAESFEAAIASCRRERFPGCGHQIHRDRPAEVLQAFREFIASCE